MTLAQGTRIGRYEIKSRLGAGGMGEIYLAQDTELERTVALKILPPDAASDDERLLRFVQEARAASALNHPNIITIFEVGHSNALHFMATEFVEGVTLFERMKSGAVPVSELLDVAIQVASALATAHQAGIIHRDIKPENIMLRRDGYVKVLDFGLAKLTERIDVDTEAQTKELFKTNPGVIMGTFQYMSPEQVRGQEVTEATDIFSLGVVLYEMAAQRKPFPGETASDVLAAILMVEPEPLSRVATGVPLELERIVMKALAKRKEERYRTIKDLLTDLRLLKQRLDLEAQLEKIMLPDSEAALTSSIGAEKTRIIEAESTLAKAIPEKTSLPARARPPRKKSINSIAVLPLLNASQDPNTEYLADGITESIINTLSELPKLKVMARSTVFRYKGREVDAQEAGSSLGVGAVLTGKVLQLGANLIIKTELVNASDGSQMWGEQYNRKPADVLQIQEEISGEIAAKLRLKLSGEQKQRLKKRQTENTNAYKLYLKGRYFWNKRTAEGLKKSIEFFDEAIAEDPAYALAYAGLADAYNMLGTYNLSLPHEVLSRAKAAAEKALEIDSRLAEAHTSLARVKADYDWDWETAGREFKRAIKLNPNYATAHHWYALHLMAMGRFDEATTEILRAQQLDPLSLSISVSTGLPFYWSRRYDEAITQFRKTLALDLSFPLAHVLLAQAYLPKGMTDEAVAEMEKALQLEDTLRVRALLGYALAVSGRTREAAAMLEEFQLLSSQQYVAPYFMALIHAGLNQTKSALAWLERAYEERSEWLVWLKVDPKIDNLRSSPDFDGLMRRVGLTA